MLTKKPEKCWTNKANIREISKDHIEEIMDDLVGLENCIINQNLIQTSCPIHGGDNPTAFAFYRESGLWYCFTHHCEEDVDINNVFSLVEKVKNIREVEAIRWVASKCGLDPSGKDIPNKPKKPRKPRTYPETKITPIPIANIRWKIDNSYFRQYGISDQTAEKFYISVCNTPKKRMYNRAFAPIFDDSGQFMIGTTGRTLYTQCELCGSYHSQSTLCFQDGGPKPIAKWLHYGVHSGNILYNSWNSKDLIAETGVAVIVEGPKNVWSLDQQGVYNAVATLGNKITEGHIRKLLSFGCKTTILLYDNDPGGLDEQSRYYRRLINHFKVINLANHLPIGRDIAEASVETNIVKDIIIPEIKKIERIEYEKSNQNRKEADSLENIRNTGF